MIYMIEPNDFNPRFETVSCFIEHQEQILFLLRQDHKSEGNKWGIPAGKIDPGEDALTAIQREIYEETRIKLEKVSFKFFKRVFVKYDEYDFVFTMFSAQAASPEVVINAAEHKDFIWQDKNKMLKLNLVKDMDACIKLLEKSFA